MKPDDPSAASAMADAEALAKAIVASMLEDEDPTKPGPETMGLLQSIGRDIADDLKIYDYIDDLIGELTKRSVRPVMVANGLAQIAVSLLKGLKQQGQTIERILAQLASPYRLPQTE